jgi:hypothetical protein
MYPANISTFINFKDSRNHSLMLLDSPFLLNSILIEVLIITAVKP